MLNTFEVHAYHIVCEVSTHICFYGRHIQNGDYLQVYKKYGQRLLDQEIVLILHGRYTQDWWESAHTKVNSSCTHDQVMKALNKTLALTPNTYDLMENRTAMAYSGNVGWL